MPANTVVGKKLIFFGRRNDHVREPLRVPGSLRQLISRFKRFSRAQQGGCERLKAAKRGIGRAGSDQALQMPEECTTTIRRSCLIA